MLNTVTRWILPAALAVWTALPVLPAAAADAPAPKTFGWRGDGTGRYPKANPPIHWDIDEGTGILWKADVGAGHASPLIVGSRIFLTAEREKLLCLDRSTGKVLWTADSGYATLPAGITPPNKRPPAFPDCGYSTPTPASDGRSLFACYGSGIVVCCDLDGQRRWIRFLDRELINDYGRTASPLLTGGKLLISIGGLLALDPKTGQILWETAEARPSYGTPARASVAGVDVVITSNGDCVRVADGKILAAKLGEMEYTSPVVHEGVAYFAGEPTVAVQLVAGPGATVRPRPLWENDDMEGNFYASPVCHDGLLYCANNEGLLYALDAKTGEIVWQQELQIPSASGLPGIEPANIYGSLTLAGRHLLLANDVGNTLLLAPGRRYEETAHNYLDAGSGASPVPDGKLLLLRGGKKLYGIGAR